MPGKALLKINGKPVLYHLIDRLLRIQKPVILAIPAEDKDYYQELLEHYGDRIESYWDSNYGDDPLKRMALAAIYSDLDHVIRVTHDKIFIDHDCYAEMLNQYMERGLDYAYSSDLPAGAGFEIIKTDTLVKASDAYNKVEHISYAIKAITENKMDVPLTKAPKSESRFLIDFPEDVTFMKTLFACNKDTMSLKEAVDFCDENPWINKLNKQPQFTIYTCAYNAEKYLKETIGCTISQNVFNLSEYLLVDDFSNDKTSMIMSRAASEHDNIKYIRNDKNLGLASSSNIALQNARGKYIIRIDADDYFTRPDAINKLYLELINRNLDAVYPGYYDGQMGVIGNPQTYHHAAGTLFKTRALNHIKFTEQLRNYDGYDLYLRAKTQLDIGYLQGPYFFYRHREDSMSRTNLNHRESVKASLEAKHGI